MCDGVRRNLPGLEAAGAHGGRCRQRDRRAVDGADRFAGNPAVGGVADDGRRIGRGELQRERSGVEAAQVTEDRRRGDGREGRAGIRRAGRGGVAVHIRAEESPGINVECVLTGIGRRDRAGHRAAGVNQADVFALFAELKVGVEVGRAVGRADIEAGCHHDQIAAGRDAAACREIPLARLVGVVCQRPSGQIDRLGAGVVQLDPVALRVRRVLVEVGLVLLVAGRGLGLARADKEAAGVGRARERARGRAGRGKRGAPDQVRAGQTVVVNLKGEHIVAAGQQRVGGAEGHHLHGAAVLAGAVAGTGQSGAGGDRVRGAHIAAGHFAAVEIDDDAVVVVERELERLGGGGLSRRGAEQGAHIERRRDAVHHALQVRAEHQAAGGRALIAEGAVGLGPGGVVVAQRRPGGRLRQAVDETVVDQPARGLGHAGEVAPDGRVRDQADDRRAGDPQVRHREEVAAGDGFVVGLDAEPVRAGSQARAGGAQIDDRGRRAGEVGVERGLVAVGVHAGVAHVAAGHLHAVQEGDEPVVEARHEFQPAARGRLAGGDGEGLSQIERGHLVLDEARDVQSERDAAERAKAERSFRLLPQAVVKRIRIPGRCGARHRVAIRRPLQLPVGVGGRDLVDHDLSEERARRTGQQREKNQSAHVNAESRFHA